MNASAVPTPRPSATILLLRDGAQGMEVFMVVRHQQIDFASGALVFPGGKLAQGDGDARVRARCLGAESLDDAELALRVCAVREAFEESGILLAQQDDGQAIPAARLADLGARYRRALDRGETGMADLLHAEHLRLDLRSLTPFAHWITPTFMPKRFDTWFYLAVAPADQAGAHDGSETVDCAWLRPAQVIADAAAGTRTLVPATLLNVQKLGRQTRVADALAAARARPLVSVLPERVEGAPGLLLRIPAEADYDVTEVRLDAPV